MISTIRANICTTNRPPRARKFCEPGTIKMAGVGKNGPLITPRRVRGSHHVLGVDFDFSFTLLHVSVGVVWPTTAEGSERGSQMSHININDDDFGGTILS